MLLLCRYCPEQPQNDTAEQFLVFPYSNVLAPGQPLAPGSKVILKSVASGKFCQVIAVEQRNHIICNLTSMNLASPLDYTGEPTQSQVQRQCAANNIAPVARAAPVWSKHPWAP